jgi:hypothetical protein
MSKLALPVVSNAAEATFDCIFGRGCEGICCKNGRPSVDPAEQAAIKGVVSRVLPHLRPEARKLVETGGFLSKRTKLGQPMLRVVGEWCVFFNAGCTLHASQMAMPINTSRLSVPCSHWSKAMMGLGMSVSGATKARSGIFFA